uniref:Uncharacterized protein n=1 Tax=Romanomermis culicivorax TaxID=13658 RepID=A0A915HGB2_ROMCU
MGFTKDRTNQLDFVNDAELKGRQFFQLDSSVQIRKRVLFLRLLINHMCAQFTVKSGSDVCITYDEWLIKGRLKTMVTTSNSMLNNDMQ